MFSMEVDMLFMDLVSDCIVCRNIVDVFYYI